MGHVLTLLQEMRRRPGMYLGVPSITRLAAYLRGYDHAAERLGGKSPDPFLAEFRDWIHKRFGSNRQSWEDTILQHSAGEAEAQERFWQLLDEFLTKRELPAGRPEAPDTGPFPPAAQATSGPMTKNS
ncbi:MAG TPA: hypothetical protein VFE78_18180 [Gemmataceae bacterium]|jgi:hypothetical protein|nr:hypothetical protein [Gemmataceae bacterium]